MDNFVKMSLRLVVLFVVCVFAGCQKDKDGSPTVVEGSISLEVHAVHHQFDLPAVMVYLMRNATSFPGNDSSIYTYRGQTDGYGKYTFGKLFPGNYYVHVSGYDSLWQRNVRGNAPVQLSTSTVENNYASIRIYCSE